MRCPIFIGIVDKGCIVIDSRDGEGDFCFMNRVNMVIANGMVVDDCENVHGGAKKETKARDYKDGVERFRHVTTKGRSLTPTLFNISYLYRKA